jgi:hypothetical protein
MSSSMMASVGPSAQAFKAATYKPRNAGKSNTSCRIEGDCASCVANSKPLAPKKLLGSLTTIGWRNGTDASRASKCPKHSRTSSGRVTALIQQFGARTPLSRSSGAFQSGDKFASPPTLEAFPATVPSRISLIFFSLRSAAIWRLPPPTILHPRHSVKHGLTLSSILRRPMVLSVRHEVPMPLEVNPIVASRSCE